MTVGVAEHGQDLLFGRVRASAIRSSMSARRPAATASTARPWPRADFSEDSEEKRPTVQVGDPFTEKLLIEACLELMASDAIVAIQDMGAAGLTSSSVEMASQGRRRHRARHERGPLPRGGDDALRDDAVGKPGADADGAEARPRGRGRGDLPQMGAGFRGDRPRSPTPATWCSKWNGEIAADIPLAPLADEAPLLRPAAGSDDRTAARRSPTCPNAPTSPPTCSS